MVLIINRFPLESNPDYQFRIDEGINKCKRFQKSFYDKSGFRKVFRISQGTDDFSLNSGSKKFDKKKIDNVNLLTLIHMNLHKCTPFHMN